MLIGGLGKILGATAPKPPSGTIPSCTMHFTVHQRHVIQRMCGNKLVGRLYTIELIERLGLTHKIVEYLRQGSLRNNHGVLSWKVTEEEDQSWIRKQ